MANHTDQVIALLTEQNALLRGILVALRDRVTPMEASSSVASDRDLDDPKRGNPKVRLNPRDWRGASMKGRQFSECPPEFLDLLAETLDYFAGKEETEGKTHNGTLVAPWTRKDAARARGWAKRMRDGKHHRPQTLQPENEPATWAADAPAPLAVNPSEYNPWASDQKSAGWD